MTKPRTLQCLARALPPLVWCTPRSRWRHPGDRGRRGSFANAPWSSSLSFRLPLGMFLSLCRSGAPRHDRSTTALLVCSCGHSSVVNSTFGRRRLRVAAWPFLSLYVYRRGRTLPLTPVGAILSYELHNPDAFSFPLCRAARFVVAKTCGAMSLTVFPLIAVLSCCRAFLFSSHSDASLPTARGS